MSGWIDAEGRAERAHKLYDQGRLAEAAAELRAAIEISPQNPTWYFNLGLTMEAMDDFTRAAKAYRSALHLDPADRETLCCLGINLTRMGRYAEAIECFERIERIDPTYEPGYCNRIRRLFLCNKCFGHRMWL